MKKLSLGFIVFLLFSTDFSCVKVDESKVQASANFMVKADYLEIETIDELRKMTKGGVFLSEIFNPNTKKH